MNLALSPQLKSFVQSQLDSGRYISEEAVCVAALEALAAQEQLNQLRREALKQDVMAGTAEADRGELLDGETVINDLHQKLNAWRAEAEAKS
jgi:antitoxin ParD1/3/4